MNDLDKFESGDVVVFDQEYDKLLQLHELYQMFRPPRCFGDYIYRRKEKVLEIANKLRLKDVVFKWNVAKF